MAATRKKGWTGRLLLGLAGLALLGLCVFLLSDRLLAKSALDLCPEMGQATTCQLVQTTVEDAQERTVTGSELEELLGRLRQTNCYRDGWTEGLYEGEVYHLYFYAEGRRVGQLAVTSRASSTTTPAPMTCGPMN